MPRCVALCLRPGEKQDTKHTCRASAVMALDQKNDALLQPFWKTKRETRSLYILHAEAGQQGQYVGLRRPHRYRGSRTVQFG